jgi:hypothetical protein
MVDVITVTHAVAELAQVIDASTLPLNLKRELVTHLQDTIKALQKKHGGHEATDRLRDFENQLRPKVSRIDPNLAAILLHAAQVIMNGVDGR